MKNMHRPVQSELVYKLAHFIPQEHTGQFSSGVFRSFRWEFDGIWQGP